MLMIRVSGCELVVTTHMLAIQVHLLFILLHHLFGDIMGKTNLFNYFANCFPLRKGDKECIMFFGKSSVDDAMEVLRSI